jgi:hypothetical protein
VSVGVCVALVFLQEIHLGEDGLVVVDPRSFQTVLYVPGAQIAHYTKVTCAPTANGSDQDDRQHMVVLAESPTTSTGWVAHVLATSATMVARPVTQHCPPTLTLFFC